MWLWDPSVDVLSRHGHALAVAGNVAFLFGGVSSVSQEVSISSKALDKLRFEKLTTLSKKNSLDGDGLLFLTSYLLSSLQVDTPVYFNDFYMLTGTII